MLSSPTTSQPVTLTYFLQSTEKAIADAFYIYSFSKNNCTTANTEDSVHRSVDI